MQTHMTGAGSTFVVEGRRKVRGSSKLTCEIGSQRAELGQSNGTQLMPRYSLPQWADETREIGENGCENICSGTPQEQTIF
jgi:hypothetical protein